MTYDLDVGPPTAREMLQLEQWRKDFPAADLEIPSGPGTATAVARRADGTLIESLSASIITAVSLDPLLRDPQAGKREVLQGLLALTTSLEYQAKCNGAAASFIAIPNLLPEYQSLMSQFRFSETAQNCKVYRRLYHS